MIPTQLTNLQKLFLVSASTVLIVGALYLARTVLIPVAFAVLLTFILSPLVAFIQRRGLGRLPAVGIVTLFVLIVIVGIFATFFVQVRDLASELPDYKAQIVEKIRSLREGAEGSWLANLHDSIRDINRTVAKEKEAAPPAPGDPKEPIPVRIESNEFPFINSVAGGALNFFVDAGLVLLLVLFMLMQREEWRNRIIRLWGDKNVSQSTKALDEAGQRMSSYLLMQLFINFSYGVFLGVGLWFIDVPYAFIWGFLAAILRYIPYVGPWVAAVFPLISALALMEGWTPFLLTAGFIIVLELFSNNIMEPLLYARSTGVSELALLVAAAFWTWLWGPLGLVLSTPLTVCLVVFGRYVPGLEFLEVLLGDTPVLEKHVAFYQRLLARDPDEAVDLIEEYLSGHSVDVVHDEVLVPALVLAGKDRERGDLSAADHEIMLREAREVFHEAVSPAQDKWWIEHDRQQERSEVPAEPQRRALVYAIACRDESDELLLEMFKEYVNPSKCEFHIVSAQTLLGELLTKMQEEPPDVIVIGALPLRRAAHTRYLCKKIRSELPDVPILVGCWGLSKPNAEAVTPRLQEAGATQIGTTFKESRDQLAPMLQVANAQDEALVG